MDYDELVQRLRGYNPPDRVWDDQRPLAQAIYDSADAITALQARVAELTQEVSAQMAAVMHYSGIAGLNLGRAERAEADLAAARAAMTAAVEALDEAQAYTSSPSWSPSMTRQCFVAASQLRAALAAPGEGK